MKTRSASPSLTLSRAFEQFIEASSFVRRTRESYTEDLAPLLAECGQSQITALTADDVQAFLARQEALVIDIDDISWSERSILIHGKGDRPHETFFSCVA